MFSGELKALKKINNQAQGFQVMEQAYLGIPQIISSGSIAQILEDRNKSDYALFSYMIIPRYGTTLDRLFEKSNYLLSRLSTISLGIRLIEIIQ